MWRLIFCTALLSAAAAFADEPKAVVEPDTQPRWDAVFPEIRAEKQDNKWLIVETYVPSIRHGDQVVALNGKTLAADADFPTELNNSISASNSQPIRIRLKRTELVNKRKKTVYAESFIPVRTLFDVLSEQFISSYDPINEQTTYMHKPADEAQVTSLLPAIAQLKTGKTIIGFNLMYLHSEWLFIQHLTVKNDGEKLDLLSSRTTRDVLPSAKVIETCTFLDTDVPNLRRVIKWFAANPQGVLYVRAVGRTQYRDHVVTANEGVMFRNTLLLESFLKQKAEQR